MRLPVVSARKVLRAPRRVGYEFDHQRGSHMILRCDQPPYRRLSVPDHKEIARGTPPKIIRQAGLTVDEFVSLLR